MAAGDAPQTPVDVIAMIVTIDSPDLGTSPLVNENW